MKKFNYLLLIIFAFTLTNCSGVKITSDQDSETDFSKYKTYSFLGLQENINDIMTSFDQKRMLESFGDEFELRNLEYVEKGGDMTISMFLVVDKKTSVSSYTNYYGHGGYGGYGRYNRYGYGWGGGFGGSSSTTYTENDYLKGTLVMDAFDEESGNQIWQGIATGTVNENPQKREKRIPKSVRALMSKFPVAVPK